MNPAHLHLFFFFFCFVYACLFVCDVSHCILSRRVFCFFLSVFFLILSFQEFLLLFGSFVAARSLARSLDRSIDLRVWCD